MTRALNPERIDPLRQALDALGRRRRWTTIGARALRGLRWWLLAVLVVVLADAAWDLVSPVRLGLLILLLLGLAFALWRSWLPRRPAQREMLGNARIIEAHHQLDDNPLVNALLLPVAPNVQLQDDPLAGALVERAHQRGRRTLETVDGRIVVDHDALRRQGGWLWAVAVAWLVVTLIHPPVLTRGLARLLMPWQPVPPVSLTRFDVQVAPDPPREGDDVTVVATVTGRLPSTADLVELDDAGREVRRWPMALLGHASAQATLSAEDGRDPRLVAQDAGLAIQFQRTLRDLREPIALRIEAGDAHSATFRIEPLPPEPAELAPDPAADPAGHEPPPATQPEEATAPATQPAAGPTEPSLLDYLAEHHPDLHDRLQQLNAHAAAIGQMAQDVADADPQTVDWKQWQQQLGQLERELQAFQAEARDLAGVCRLTSPEAPSPHDRQLRQLAEALESMGLCQLGMCPNPGAGPPSPAPLPSPSMSEGLGTAGQGGGGLMLGPAGFWAQAVNEAGLADAAMLQQLLAPPSAAAQRSPLGAPGPIDADATTPPSTADATAAPSYHETLRGAEQPLDQPDAVMRQVPPAYRDLVGAYFQRLVEDESTGDTPPANMEGSTR